MEAEVISKGYRGVVFHTSVRFSRRYPHTMMRRFPLLSQTLFNDLVTAVEDYEDEGRAGLLIRTLNACGFLTQPLLTFVTYGEIDALVELALRGRGLYIKGRHLLNLGSLEHIVAPPDWDGRRAFSFLLTCGRVAVCNGESRLCDFRCEVFNEDEWAPIEAEFHAAFPVGPTNTYEGEIWLRRRLGMDAWDSHSSRPHIAVQPLPGT